MSGETNTGNDGFELAKARIVNYGGAYDAVLVHDQLDEALTNDVKTAFGNRPDLIVSNEQSDCTEITFSDGSRQEPIPPDVLVDRVAGILTSAGHEASIMQGLVEIDVLDPAPERVYERFQEAA